MHELGADRIYIVFSPGWFVIKYGGIKAQRTGILSTVFSAVLKPLVDSEYDLVISLIYRANTLTDFCFSTEVIYCLIR